MKISMVKTSLRQPRCLKKKRIYIIKEKNVIVICRRMRKTIMEQGENPEGALPHICSSPTLLTMHPSINSVVFHFITPV